MTNPGLQCQQLEGPFLWTEPLGIMLSASFFTNVIDPVPKALHCAELLIFAISERSECHQWFVESPMLHRIVLWAGEYMCLLSQNHTGPNSNAMEQG